MTTDAFRALRRGSDSVHGVCVLEHRHPDGTRWIPTHRYPTREIAEEHLERLVEAGGGPGRGTGREAPDRGRRPDPRLTSGE
jgi:hypothetical protein